MITLLLFLFGIPQQPQTVDWSFDTGKTPLCLHHMTVDCITHFEIKRQVNSRINVIVYRKFVGDWNKPSSENGAVRNFSVPVKKLSAHGHVTLLIEAVRSETNGTITSIPIKTVTLDLP
jgi:hypothetical protein